MTEQEWEEYLLSIGVTNLNDQSEIDSKLEEVEQENSEYQTALVQAIEEISNEPSKPICKENIISWLLSLAD